MDVDGGKELVVDGGKCLHFKCVTYLYSKKGIKQRKGWRREVVCIQSAAIRKDGKHSLPVPLLIAIELSH